ncbi:hypothetical protein [Aquimarina spongiae]|uniref:DUF3021 domain-containing protein n=1 Tax=Aquimarina spongiae TaxID=570521 RepID=A0A1M6JJ16_9FLAO|nr:hypothetical protein [Aquimarina spongiae]SHJ46689.1 hypothetical protein SAMN04488508_10992 [Aquimarina spongiae]
MNIKATLFCVLGIIWGTIALAMFTSFVQEILFNGAHYTNASTSIVIFSGFFTFLAAIAAGHVSRILGKTYTFIIPWMISNLIIMETVFLIFFGNTNDPIWYTVVGGCGLILGIWIGYHFLEIKDSFVTGSEYYSKEKV